MTTHEYTKSVEAKGWTPFSGRLWQRDYFEHIIRNDESLNKIREYVTANPAQWENDPENPKVVVNVKPDIGLPRNK